MPSGLLVAICRVENNWNPHRPGAAGEVGLCQIKPSTVRMICPTCDKEFKPLHQGMTGRDVVKVQAMLKQKGYDPGTIDGQFGLRTHIAVTLFQKSQKLSSDGIVGPRTWKTLFGSLPEGMPIKEQLKDPIKNIDYAARYLRWLSRHLGTIDPMILAAAYNGGPANPTVVYMMKVRRGYQLSAK